MGACIGWVKRHFAKPATQEEYIYLPSRSPKRSHNTRPVKPHAAVTIANDPLGPPASEQKNEVAAPPPPDPETLQRQHDELIQRQSSFIHLKLSVENLVKENQGLGADDGDEILAWLESTEGSPATIYQDINDTKNILAELKKQNEELRSRQQHTPATSTRRAARSKNKNAFAAVESQ